MAPYVPLLSRDSLVSVKENAGSKKENQNYT